MLASLDVCELPYGFLKARACARGAHGGLRGFNPNPGCSPNRRLARLPPQAAVSRERPRMPRRPTARRQHGAQKRRKLEPLRLAAFCVRAGALPLLDLARRACEG